MLVLLKCVQFTARFDAAVRVNSDGNAAGSCDLPTRDERRAVVAFARTRLVIFVGQLVELLKTFRYATSELNTELRQVLLLIHIQSERTNIVFVLDLSIRVVPDTDF